MLAQLLPSHDLKTVLTIAAKALAELSSGSFEAAAVMEAPIMKALAQQVDAGLPLRFVLPAFPAKSPSPNKTAGVMPDFGEVIALQRLDQLCQQLGAVYDPGAEVLICSDGRIFSDVVGVADEVIDRYQEGIEGIIADFRLRHLRTFSLDDLFPHVKGDELRERVLWQFGKCAEEIRHKVRTEEDFSALFNGIHRFMVEDRHGLYPEKTKNQINKETKALTYELLRRSDAWSQVLSHYHRGALRLSIHPYPLHHEKFGVCLVPAEGRWATPWHNVTVKHQGGFQLMHLAEALKLGARKNSIGGKYVFFEV